ncbi:hypothetical protein BGW36DRAFT_399749 [Talaromyces proteolyticus]|uniref:Methyltransferase domain-containing protein n=1 Tax=Talaromyces proteolyticus TaxID=1131652 RepID=A0AAD4KQ57_9EURO|nr:uncharacterized protein BGW36DRAFT_399749 [Talaromyces proteolyticus]KAH8693009.1 hypothetical protein BGW36DRAFT_399749 [Talaromyces proteolyticus]
MAQRFVSFPSWDHEIDISGLLDGDGGKLLHEYANIELEDMEHHVKIIARKGWDILRYPCFQKFLFLHLDLSRSPVYNRILKEIQAGNLFLDLGCGLGQDIRRLVQDGAPAEHLIGLDLERDYINLGFELFNDQQKLRSVFLAQDFAEDTPEISRLAKRIKIINSGYFMHLWNWEKQLNAAKRMIQLVLPGSGSIICGVHFGSQSAGMWKNVPPGFEEMFLHNRESLSKLWNQAEKETKTSWKFECVEEDDEYCRDLDPEGCRLRWIAEQE